MAAYSHPSTWPSGESSANQTPRVSSVSPISPPDTASSPPALSPAELPDPEMQQRQATPVTNGHYMPYVPPASRQPENPDNGTPSMYGHAPVYSEVDNNPLPQIVFGDAPPEVVKPPSDIRPDAAREDFVSRDNQPIPVHNDDGGEETKPVERAWYKGKRVTMLAISGIVIIGILAVVFGTLGGLGVFTNNNRSSAFSPNQSPSSTFSTSSILTATSTSLLSSTSTTSTAFPSPTSDDPETCKNGGKISGVKLVTGLVESHGLGWTFPNAGTMSQCCKICYLAEPAGCNLWVFDPTNDIVQCTIILGWFGKNPDSTCPYGHTNATNFAIQYGGNGTLGNGPCSEPSVAIGPLPRPTSRP